MRRYAESSAALITALNPVIGYERAAKVAKRAMAEGRTVPEIVREGGACSTRPRSSRCSIRWR